jgi:hypothetical protein
LTCGDVAVVVYRWWVRPESFLGVVCCRVERGGVDTKRIEQFGVQFRQRVSAAALRMPEFDPMWVGGVVLVPRSAALRQRAVTLEFGPVVRV